MATTPIARLKKILLVRNDRIGDLVLSLPAFQAVRRQWPRAHVAALVSPYTAPLLSGTRLVDEVILDDGASEPQTLAERLKPEAFQAALVFNSSTRNCRALWHSGIPRRVCWAYKLAGMLLGNYRVLVHRTHPPIHEAEFALKFVRKLGGAAVMENLSPQLHVDPHTRERIATRIGNELGTMGPLFGVHPGNGASAFNWPLARYVELINRLAMHGRVMITGSAAERQMLETIQSRLSRAIENRVKCFTDFELGELAAALTSLTSFTASSTGPMHMAGLLETPVVALFSPHPVHSPAKWAPLGSKHTIFIASLHAGEDARVPRERGEAVMGRIGVDEVVAANLRYASATTVSGPAAGLARAS